MRTNDLREVVRDRLETIKPRFGINNIYYKEAEKDALYPHLVFSYAGDDISDFFRKDYIVDIDVWTKDQMLTTNIADEIEDLFCNFNNPKESILPTFFLQTKQFIDDPDKTICHEVVRLQCQLYDNE